ncbi:MAG: hypothetical protein R3268_00755, partial [Acidiferrobacterales bacterium]|nr:hypothetical protein [Acidiferrobacterales bacterium]
MATPLGRLSGALEGALGSPLPRFTETLEPLFSVPPAARPPPEVAPEPFERMCFTGEPRGSRPVFLLTRVGTAMIGLLIGVGVPQHNVR